MAVKSLENRSYRVSIAVCLLVRLPINMQTHQYPQKVALLLKPLEAHYCMSWLYIHS
jgi:hypothetical protein